MRGFDCEDGQHIHGDSDEQILQDARKHADEVHADRGYTDDQLREMIKTGGYEDTQHTQAAT